MNTIQTFLAGVGIGIASILELHDAGIELIVACIAQVLGVVL